ncbi:DNA-binding response regulator [Reticulibacter mediterranei]|uniref:DNA-binding response regulator n=1 Tax=Reticulibacter mediterranei TaxID=2778369 RepID=A0A8J3N685_9CHLR|nr:response regulator transcription factor [Reticulibacter mediterranei]GHO97298.1 DNA-binding response regulator [Reticulibacter mediterranei]
MKRILVVEDEPCIASALSRGLTFQGFAVQVAASGEAALENMRICPQDLVLLDVMLPDMNGFEVCRRLRDMEDKALPILMLTARDEVKDKITGLDSGADDYITKPFDFDELVARIRAGLRRVMDTQHVTHKLVVNDLVLDTEARQAWRGGKALELTKREYDLLELLMRNNGHVLTKGCIFERVWGYDSEAGLEVIKVYMNYIRAKLNIGGKPDLIHAVRGVGYVLKA